MSEWYAKWQIKINQNKSIHTTFTLKQCVCPTVTLDNIQIPTSNTVRYLGVNLDKRLTGSNHVRTKWLTFNARLRMLKPILSKNFSTSLRTKLQINKTLLKLIWTYWLQLWGSAKISNTYTIEAFQNIVLRRLSNAPPYISNLTLLNDLNTKSVNEEPRFFYMCFH